MKPHNLVRPWSLAVAAFVLALGACSGGGGDGGNGSSGNRLVVNSLLDSASPPAGTVTLRSALAAAQSGERITFDPALDGGTIALSIVGAEHTVLKGEVMGIRDEPSGPVSYLVGYFERDYGRSALYARKDVVIDAASLSRGITLAWTPGTQPAARVLAVYGDLTLINVDVTGGRSVTEKLTVVNTDDQPWTLARGAAVAVWGVARLSDCALYGNEAVGDFDSSRDRGAFGGGLYADVAHVERCVVSGNSVTGAGAAGGGVYVVGGAEHSSPVSTVDRCALTGNRLRGLFAYGAGVYSDGGGIGKARTLRVTNSTIARNLVEPAPGLPSFLLRSGYWRGGGVYASNGYLEVQGSTIVQNLTRGVARTDSLGRQNLAGGIAATVGNAHAVEDMTISHSIVAGNQVEVIGGAAYPHDVFTGSLFYFRSGGHNRFGTLDFSQILVPVGEPGWNSLVRKHYPQTGDEDGVTLSAVVDTVGGVTASTSIVSMGVDAGGFVPLAYDPQGTALSQVPRDEYRVDEIHGEYSVGANATDDFLAIVLGRIERTYGLTGFAAEFTAEFEAFLQAVDTDPAAAGLQPYKTPGGAPVLTLAATHWYGPAQTWPREVVNHPYIEFWHRLDAKLAQAGVAGLGPEMLGDAAWLRLFPTDGALQENPGLRLTLSRDSMAVRPLAVDQLGRSRSTTGSGDIGAIEK
jgi:hypothetical protein